MHCPLFLTKPGAHWQRGEMQNSAHGWTLSKLICIHNYFHRLLTVLLARALLCPDFVRIRTGWKMSSFIHSVCIHFLLGVGQVFTGTQRLLAFRMYPWAHWQPGTQSLVQDWIVSNCSFVEVLWNYWLDSDYHKLVRMQFHRDDRFDWQDRLNLDW